MGDSNYIHDNRMVYVVEDGAIKVTTVNDILNPKKPEEDAPQTPSDEETQVPEEEVPEVDD